jgi:DNA (cytosine-5)-methyltransferase 1
MNIAILDNALDSVLSYKRPNSIKFIDLFAGMGGTRVGFEQSLKEKEVEFECVFTSELKDYAIDAYQCNFGNEKIHGDITKIDVGDIPDFDYLLAGFPCQPFSSAGKRLGFLDQRGGLFFTIFDILKEKKPNGFLLENVDALTTHDNGKTLSTIIKKLESLDYFVDFKILNSSDFGIPQVRKRVYILGHKNAKPKFDDSKKKFVPAKEFIDYDSPFKESQFSQTLRKHFSKDELEGKSIKDKRGGKNNIHSWDIGLKGKVNKRQKDLLSDILKKRRYKKWAEKKGIQWMDGMPLTLEEIKTFHDNKYLESDLSYLENLGYLKLEHPKDIEIIDGVKKRVYKLNCEKGYNIVAGKLSFPIAKILEPDGLVPTIVATEVGKLAISTDKGVRSITIKEGLNFSGFPDWYSLDTISYKNAFDLLGNTVMPPVIKYVTDTLIKVHNYSNASE